MRALSTLRSAGALRHLVAAVLLMPAVGCILIAPSFEPVDDCPIVGASECGTCIRTKCQPEVNNCCGAEACREGYGAVLSDDERGSTVAALDTCAAGGSVSCADALETARGSAEGTLVTSCVTSKCAAECATGTGPNGKTPSPTSKWTCNTARGTNACGTCIYESCDLDLAGCCAEGNAAGSCAQTLSAEMSACMAGDEPGCAAMYDGDSSGKEGVVRACVIRSCEAACFGNKYPHQTCTLRESGAYCSCSSSSTQSGDECSRTELPNARCFFSNGGCLCGHYTCAWDKSDYRRPKCTCDFAHSKAEAEIASEDGELDCVGQSFGKGGPNFDETAHCCLTNVSYEGPVCECAFRPCPASSAEVFNCDLRSIRSSLVDQETDSCSQ